MSRGGSLPGLCVVLGAPRSGTTWIQRLLAGSPFVASPQESHVFFNYLAPLWRQWGREKEHLARALDALDSASGVEDRIIGLPTILEEDDLIDVLRELLRAVMDRSIAAKPGATVVLEKTPSNSLCVDLIHRVCPEARFLHIVRDPRDVMASLRDASSGWGNNWAPTNPAAAARLWLAHYEGARRAAAYGKTGYLEIRFEELRADPLGSVGLILRFLGLADDPADLVSREAAGAGASFADVFAFGPTASSGLRGLPGVEPHGFRSHGRRPLGTSARRSAELVLGDVARGVGYTQGWDEPSTVARRLWEPWMHVSERVYHVRQGRRRRNRGRTVVHP